MSVFPPHPIDGSTQPHVVSVTSAHTASSGATQAPSLPYDGRFSKQSVLALSPFSGQAVPGGTGSADAQITPRPSGKSYVASPQTLTSRAYEGVTSAAIAASEAASVRIELSFDNFDVGLSTSKLSRKPSHCSPIQREYCKSRPCHGVDSPGVRGATTFTSEGAIIRVLRRDAATSMPDGVTTTVTVSHRHNLAGTI